MGGKKGAQEGFATNVVKIPRENFKPSRKWDAPPLVATQRRHSGQWDTDRKQRLPMLLLEEQRGQKGKRVCLGLKGVRRSSSRENPSKSQAETDSKLSHNQIYSGFISWKHSAGQLKKADQYACRQQLAGIQEGLGYADEYSPLRNWGRRCFGCVS